VYRMSAVDQRTPSSSSKLRAPVVRVSLVILAETHHSPAHSVILPHF